jgi:DNA primase
VEGGKDPDEVLREQGPAALRAQLGRTTPFAEALFRRERDEAEPLDTPERKTALKVRLRKLAATIADPDLSAAYKEDLLARYEAMWPTREPVYTVGAAAREMSRARWDRRRPVKTGATPEAKDALERLRASAKPLSAALAIAALRDPAVLDDAIERVGSHGFGDARLDGLAHELVSLRYEADHLEFDAALRRLQAKGFSADDLARLERDAARAGVSAPFLDPATARDQARQLWRQAFDLLMQLESLERAVEAAARDLDRDQDATTLISLKAERDHLRKLLNSDWAHGDESHPVLPH